MEPPGQNERMKTLTRTMKTATRGTGRSSVNLNHAASGKVEPDHEGGGLIEGWNLGPFGICDYDGPETVRLRKYATGTHLLLEEIEVETGATPREVVWTKNKARLYRYLRPDECPGKGVGRRRSVPVLLIYGFVLKPYVLDLVPGNSLGVRAFCKTYLWVPPDTTEVDLEGRCPSAVH